MNYLIDSYTDIGGRCENEDSLLISKSANGILLVVADGLGGHSNGKEASCTAVRIMKEEFDKAASFDMEKAIMKANLSITKRQAQTGYKMHTTLAAAWITDNKTIIAYVGDSRIYALKGSEMVYQSIDHSAAQMAVFAGEIKYEDIRNYPERNILTNALGVLHKIKISKNELNTSDYDSLLLCSDGFWEYVYEDEIIKHKCSSKNPDVWIYKMREELTKKITENNDNNTAIAMIII